MEEAIPQIQFNSDTQEWHTESQLFMEKCAATCSALWEMTPVKVFTVFMEDCVNEFESIKEDANKFVAASSGSSSAAISCELPVNKRQRR